MGEYVLEVENLHITLFTEQESCPLYRMFPSGSKREKRWALLARAAAARA